MFFAVKKKYFSLEQYLWQDIRLGIFHMHISPYLLGTRGFTYLLTWLLDKYLGIRSRYNIDRLPYSLFAL
jgi:hypothetical protein